VNLSAVFVTHNSEGCVAGALESMRRHFPEAELVVVDNASNDRTREIVRAKGAVRLVEQEENLGFGRACNVGADHSTGSHLFFVNPDARIVGVDSEAVGKLLNERPFGLVGASFVSSGGSDGSLHGGLHPERHWFFAYVSQTFGLFRPREWPRRPPRSRPGAAVWLGGAAVLVAREEFDRLGRFDPRFFLYYEDRELSARYRDTGLPIRSTSAIRVEHQGGGSSYAEGFRTVPQGWALLGWVQYLSLRNGPKVACRAGRLAFRTLQSLDLVLSMARPAAGPRLDRKRREVGMLLDFLEEVTGDAPAARRQFCPDALRHLARRSSLPQKALRRSDRAQ
jgi:N-acetylglucosaminyl-diphospho-decaprenol L-rhamnosyltransferase